MAQKKKDKKVVQSARKLASPKYRTFRLSKKIKKTGKAIPKARKLFSRSLKHVWQHKKIFGGILAVYAVASLIFVRGFSGTTDVPFIKDQLSGVFFGATGQLVTGFTLFGVLIGNVSTAGSDEARLYQMIVLIVISLAIIWALRQTHAGNKVGIRESFYKGMYPLIPFLTVLFVITLQLLPLAIGSWLFSVTVLGGLAVTGLEQIIWSILCFLLALLTVYMVSSSIFALYVSTLPDMTPMKALRSTRELVRHRRWEIVRKVTFFPLVLLIIGSLIMLPVILLLTPIAEWVFFLAALGVVILGHSYFYSLYRELL